MSRRGGPWINRERFDGERAESLAKARLLVRLVAHECGLGLNELIGRRRPAVVVQARAGFVWAARRSIVTMHRDRTRVPVSFAVLAEALGREDHSTAMYFEGLARGFRAKVPGFAARCDRWARLQRAGKVAALVTGIEPPVVPLTIRPMTMGDSACRKAKNDLSPDDRDARRRMRASEAFLTALAAAHPERMLEPVA